MENVQDCKIGDSKKKSAQHSDISADHSDINKFKPNREMYIKQSRIGGNATESDFYDVSGMLYSMNTTLIRQMPVIGQSRKLQDGNQVRNLFSKVSNRFENALSKTHFDDQVQSKQIEPVIEYILEAIKEENHTQMDIDEGNHKAQVQFEFKEEEVQNEEIKQDCQNELEVLQLQREILQSKTSLLYTFPNDSQQPEEPNQIETEEVKFYFNYEVREIIPLRQIQIDNYPEEKRVIFAIIDQYYPLYNGFIRFPSELRYTKFKKKGFKRVYTEYGILGLLVPAFDLYDPQQWDVAYKQDQS